jgi:hypothetical protein
MLSFVQRRYGEIALACTLVAWVLFLSPLGVWSAVINSSNYGNRTAKNTLGPGDCLITTFTAATDDAYIFVGGLEVSIQFEADPDGANAVGNVDVSACTQADDDRDGTKDSSACVPLAIFDSDANGIGDTNRLASTIGQRGTAVPIAVAGWLYYDAVDVTNVPEVVTCALSTQ